MKNKKKNKKHGELDELDEGTSSIGSEDLLANIQKNRKLKEVTSVSFETEVGGSTNSSYEEGTEVSLRSKDGNRKKKSRNSEIPIDGDFLQSASSSQCLMSDDEQSEDKKGKKKKKKKKKKSKEEMMRDDERNEEFEQEKTFNEDISSSNKVNSFTVSDDKNKMKFKEGAEFKSRGEIKRKRSKKKDDEDAKATTSRSSLDEASPVKKTIENTLSNQQSQTNSSVKTDEKKSEKKRKTKDGASEVTKREKKLKPMKHIVSSSKLSTKKKRVTFSGQDEVFPSTSKMKQIGKDEEDGLVHGKRYSEEEDELIREAVFEYIRANNLGEEGLKKVINSRAHPETRGCWLEIGASLPWRPFRSVYGRAQNLFTRGEKRKWEPEEVDFIRYRREHGATWKEMGDILGKHKVHVRDVWRRLVKLENRKKGKWSQEEYQSLFDLVNADLVLKAFEEKNIYSHAMLRGNIAWSAISEKMSTRNVMHCCKKWYRQLTSSMVSQGIWADTDDYVLIDEMLKLDACCMEDVNWGNLLQNRSGEVCMKRWREMTRHIGGAREKSFMEQVQILATRYSLHTLKFREGTALQSNEETPIESENTEPGSCKI